LGKAWKTIKTLDMNGFIKKIIGDSNRLIGDDHGVSHDF
jgi:hypothetical protein